MNRNIYKKQTMTLEGDKGAISRAKEIQIYKKLRKEGKKTKKS
jgi:hypothetical protein